MTRGKSATIHPSTALSPNKSAKVGVTTMRAITATGAREEEPALFAEEGEHEQGCGNDTRQHLVRDLRSIKQFGVHKRPSNHR